MTVARAVTRPVARAVVRTVSARVVAMAWAVRMKRTVTEAAEMMRKIISKEGGAVDHLSWMGVEKSVSEGDEEQ